MANLISYFTKNSILSASAGLEIYDFTGDSTTFVQDCVRRFREAYISEEKLTNIINHLSFSHESCTCENIKKIFDCGKECYVKTPIDLFQNNLSADAAVVADYLLKTDGLYYIENSGTEEAREIKISSPISVTHMTRDVDSCSWGKRVEFRDMDGVVHNFTIKNSELMKERGSTVIEQLVDSGLVLTPNNRASKQLKNYLISAYPNKKAIEIDRCGWYKKCFILMLVYSMNSLLLFFQTMWYVNCLQIRI